MDKITERSCGGQGIRFSELIMTSLLFADDVVLMLSSACELLSLWSGSELSVEQQQCKVKD